MSILFTLVSLPSAFAGEPAPSVVTLDADSGEITIDLDGDTVEVRGELLDATCVDGERPVHCEGGVQHILLVDRDGMPVYGLIGRPVRSEGDTVVLAGEGLQFVATEDAPRWETRLYGIWGTGGAMLDLTAYDGIDGESIWGTNGTALEGADKWRPTPVAIWGTGGVAIWGTGGTVFEAIGDIAGESIGDIAGESIWGTGGTIFGTDGTEAGVRGIWGTDGVRLGGETHWAKQLRSVDLRVLLEEGLAEPVLDGVAVQMAFEETPLEVLCETFACR
jgi:hypothetical protein